MSNNEEECLICFDFLCMKEICVMSCGHKLHYECLQEWIKKKKTLVKLCPICQKDGEIINIYKINKKMRKKSSTSSILSKKSYCEEVNNMPLLSVNTTQIESKKCCIIS